jgi:hypothetical protein
LHFVPQLEQEIVMKAFYPLMLAVATLAVTGCATTNTTTALTRNDKTRHYAALPPITAPGIGPYNKFGQLYHYGSPAAYERAEDKPLPTVMEASER